MVVFLFAWQLSNHWSVECSIGQRFGSHAAAIARGTKWQPAMKNLEWPEHFLKLLNFSMILWEKLYKRPNLCKKRWKFIQWNTLYCIFVTIVENFHKCGNSGHTMKNHLLKTKQAKKPLRPSSRATSDGNRFQERPRLPLQRQEFPVLHSMNEPTSSRY